MPGSGDPTERDADCGPTSVAATIADDGRRLSAVARRLGSWSQQRARALCDLGAVALNGVGANGADRVHTGDKVALAAATAELSLLLQLPVLCDRDGVLVVHKPPGLAVHDGPRVDDSVALRLQALPGAGLAHRLDRGTSGLLVCGRDGATLAHLSAAMERGEIERSYLAIAVGTVDGDTRTIDLPLRVHDEPRGDRPKVLVDPGGMPATTHVRVLARRPSCSLLRVVLETGRTHQIRAHLAAIGHPLLGDPRYGDPAANVRARATFGTDRPLLHSERVVLTAVGGRRLRCTAFHERDFVRVFRELAEIAAATPE